MQSNLSNLSCAARNLFTFAIGTLTALGQSPVEIDDQNASTRTGQQDRSRPSIADAITCRTATGNDSHFACQTSVVIGTCLRGTHGWHSNPY